jgi:hypothetical protein
VRWGVQSVDSGSAGRKFFLSTVPTVRSRLLLREPLMGFTISKQALGAGAECVCRTQRKWLRKPALEDRPV